MAILPPIISKAGRSNKLADFLRNHPLELDPIFEEIRMFGETYVFDVLGTPESPLVGPSHSPPSLFSTTSIPYGSWGGLDSSLGSTPRSLTPSVNYRSSLSIRGPWGSHLFLPSNPSPSPSTRGPCGSQLFLPPPILEHPLTFRSNLIEPTETTTHHNPPEDQHEDSPRGTSCKESICCIVV